MDSIKIKVTETNVVITEKPKRITSGNIGLLKCELDLADAFKNLVVRVSFNGEYVTVENGKCDIPSLKEGNCQLGVCGCILDENGEYLLRISPSPTYFYVSKGSVSGFCRAFEKPSPTELENIHNAIKELQDNRVTIDTELSETSSNAIANSAVAKVLSGGRLVGIETIYDYEGLMDFYSKYFDFENDIPLIADDEFVILFVLDDIYDESGEYGDNECLLKGALYFCSNYGIVAIGEVRQEEVDALNKLLREHSDNLAKLNTEIKNKADMQNVINVATTSYGYYRETKADIAEINDKLTELEQSSTPQITVNETTAAIQPNVYYCFGEVESLNIEFAPEKADCVNEYMFEFISGSTPTNLILPADIKWATEIDVSANKKYQVSIVNNVGLMAGVDYA